MTTRTEFIAALAGTAAAATAKPAAKPKPKAATPAFYFDRDRFDAILAKPAAHRQMFGAKKLASGSVLYGMNNSIDAYENFLKEPNGSMHAVAVLYHGASIALAMNDIVWNDLLLPTIKKGPEELRKEFSDAHPGKGNPYLRSASAGPDDVSVQSLVKRGCSFFVCHNAIVGFAGMVADALRHSTQRMHDAIMAGVVPGALVVPAGVMAINACQEAKFTYIATD